MVRQQEKARKVVNKTAKVNTNALSPEIVDPIEETQNEVRLAYQTFVEAQKDLKYAVKEQEQQGENAQKIIERRYRVYEDIVEKAFQERGDVDSEAFELYRNTVEQAAAEYREALIRNLMECKTTIDGAWQVAMTAHEPTKTSLASGFVTGFSSFKKSLVRTAVNIKNKLIGTYHRVVKPHSTA